MPAVALQNQKVETLRKKYISMIKSTPAPQAAKQAMIAKAASMTKAELVSELKGVAPQAKVQAKVQAKAQFQAKAQRTSAKPRTSRKSRSRVSVKGGKAASTTIPKALRARVDKIQRAIKAKTLVARQTRGGVKLTSPKVLKAPKGFPQIDTRTLYEQFAEIYADARITSKARKTRKSVKQVFVQIQGQKMPYMIKKSKRIPTRVAAVPGQGATPFNQLSLAEQQSVVAFLNSDKAKKLREKGAPRQVKFQDVKRQSKKSKKGAANR
jgi:hypothetical protein